MDEEGLAEISAWYVRFADAEALGRSPLYEALARAVAADRETLSFLSTLPDMKRQPNLLLAAVRHLFGTPTGWSEFRRVLLAHPDAVRSLMLERSTQTNEPGRCASLLPVLARLPQPLALLDRNLVGEPMESARPPAQPVAIREIAAHNRLPEA